MSARAIAIHGNEKSGERRANLEIKSECPALGNSTTKKKGNFNFRVTISGSVTISGYCYPEVGNIFVNISAKTKIFSKIF